MTRTALSPTYYAFTGLHVVLFLLSITTVGLYGADLQRANKFDEYSTSKWVYAVVVGTLSAITCALYCVPIIIEAGAIVIASWDGALFVLWTSLFVVFSQLFVGKNVDGDGNIARMKGAVWIAFICALLWLIATLANVAYWWRHRYTRSVFTGRTKV
ncbi:hypothetical protein ACQKWADRAFT_291351 [Trichoderma austrokoningii]